MEMKGLKLQDWRISAWMVRIREHGVYALRVLSFANRQEKRNACGNVYVQVGEKAHVFTTETRRKPLQDGEQVASRVKRDLQSCKRAQQTLTKDPKNTGY